MLKYVDFKVLNNILNISNCYNATERLSGLDLLSRILKMVLKQERSCHTQNFYF
jgi:hypothetical protein